MIIRESYSYEFFSKSIDDTILNIEEESSDDLTKLYALFFTSVISLDLGNRSAFDYLIDHYKSQLPIQLQFGLYYEGNRQENPSLLLKKQMKRLKQHVKEANKDEIKNLHFKPIVIKKIT